MIETAIKLAKQANRARRENRLTDAHQDLTEAVALCRQASAHRELVQALKALAQIERDMGHGDAAQPLYEEAVGLCRAGEDVLMLAHTIRHLGDLHQDAGRVELAEPCYREALEVYRSHTQTRPGDLANAIRPMAILKEDVGEIEEARRLWAEAKDLYAAIKLREGVDECSDRLARLRH